MSSEAITSVTKHGLLEQAATVEWTPEQSAPEDIIVDSLRHRGVDRLTIKVQPEKPRGGFFRLFSSGLRTSKHQATLSISDETLSVETSSSKSNIKMHDIESLVLNHNNPAKASHIVLTASGAKFTLGHGLPANSLTWLRDRLLLEAAGLMWKPIFHVGRRTTAKTVCPENDAYLAWTNAKNSLIQYFISEAPERAKELVSAIHEEDWNTTSRSAAWLKSTCAVVGAGYLSEICQRIELEASTENRDRMPVLAPHFRTEYNKVLKRLCEISGQAVPEQAQISDIALDKAVAKSDASAHVLLVEDSPFNQMVATGLLEDSGHRVTVASHGSEALEKLEHGSFDLILMDCQMPVLDGFETTKKIRSREFRLGRARTPIVALTAHALQDDRKRCLSVDMDDYLSKPYTPDELIAAVDRWLNPPSFFLAEDIVSAEDEMSGEYMGAGNQELDEAVASNEGPEEAVDREHATENDLANQPDKSAGTMSDAEIAAALAPEVESDDGGAGVSMTDTDMFEDKTSNVA